jgi:signal transduction histidine kinase/ActR/RegA family two-component response regulator
VALDRDAVFQPALPKRQVSRYLLAGGIVAAATLLRAAVDPLIQEQIPYFIYVAAVVVATWFCGTAGGVFGTVVAAVAGNYFFVAPRYELIPHRDDALAMAMFASVALGLVWLVGRWKRAERALRKQADELSVLHQEAERINRLKDEFLATLSHELRTPLNAILGWSKLLDSRDLPLERHRHAIKTIVRNAEAQLRLVNDVLDVSRIISGKMSFERANVDLSRVVAAAVEMVRPAADAKGIEIHLDLAPHAQLVADADRLQQVAWNLLSNAVKFSSKRGRVDVRVEVENSQAVLTVSDSGVGIDPDFIHHLFERFRQADGSTTRRHGGLGLGLALVRHVVELHGGTVTAESAGRNLGARFTVTLPIQAVAAGAPVPAPENRRSDSVEAAVRGLEGVRVLVVDDEADARDVVSSALTGYRADVRAAASAREALQVFRSWRPDVLVADIGMPVEDGYSLIRSVRALPADAGGAVPAAALTAYARPEDRARALAAGYEEHVAKPVTPLDLALVVAHLAKRATS